MGSPQTTLTGDELVAVADDTNNQRLQNAMLLDAGAERGELILVKGLARLEGILLNAIERHFITAVNERIRWYFKNQNGPGAAIDLIHTIGLPSSYARAMPRLLEKLRIGKRASAPITD